MLVICDHAGTEHCWSRPNKAYQCPHKEKHEKMEECENMYCYPFNDFFKVECIPYKEESK
jgi:hypothetical protein